MKKLFAALFLAGFTLSLLGQGVKQSGWTTTTNPATARSALGANNATNLDSGTLPDPRLSTNVPLYSAGIPGGAIVGAVASATTALGVDPVNVQSASVSQIFFLVTNYILVELDTNHLVTINSTNADFNVTNTWNATVGAFGAWTNGVKHITVRYVIDDGAWDMGVEPLSANTTNAVYLMLNGGDYTVSNVLHNAVWAGNDLGSGPTDTPRTYFQTNFIPHVSVDLRIPYGSVVASLFTGNGSGLTDVHANLSTNLLGASSNAVITYLLTFDVTNSTIGYNGHYVQAVSNVVAGGIPSFYCTNTAATNRIIYCNDPRFGLGTPYMFTPRWIIENTASISGFNDYYANNERTTYNFTNAWAASGNSDTIIVTIGTPQPVTNAAVNQLTVSNYTGDVSMARGLPVVPASYSVQTCKEAGIGLQVRLATNGLVKVFGMGDSMVDPWDAWQHGNANDKDYGTSIYELFALLKKNFGSAGMGLYGMDTNFNVSIYNPTVSGGARASTTYAQGISLLPPYAVLLNDGTNARAVQGSVMAPTNTVNRVGAWFYGFTNAGNVLISITNATQTISCTVNCKRALPDIIYTNFAVALNNSNQMYFSGLTGTNIVIGPEFVNTNGGIEEFYYAQSGSSLFGILSAAQTNLLNSLYQSISPDLTIQHRKYYDSGANNFGNTLSMARIATVYSPFVMVRTPPINTYQNDVSDENNTIDAVAAYMGGPAAKVYTLNLNGAFPNNTTIHPTLAKARAWGVEMYNQLGLPMPTVIAGNGGGLTGLNVSTATGLLPVGTLTASPITTNGFLTSDGTTRSYTLNGGGLTNISSDHRKINVLYLNGGAVSHTAANPPGSSTVWQRGYVYIPASTTMSNYFTLPADDFAADALTNSTLTNLTVVMRGWVSNACTIPMATELNLATNTGPMGCYFASNGFSVVAANGSNYFGTATTFAVPYGILTNAVEADVIIVNLGTGGTNTFWNTELKIKN